MPLVLTLKLIFKTMKNISLIISLLLYSIVGFGQEEESLEVLKTDSTWIKEIIKFPIGFAQEIKFEGFEDLRFPPGWSKEESPNFWSYAWAWSINDVKELTEHDLEQNIQFYFDGLLEINSKINNGENIQNSNALFIKKETSDGNSQFIGKVKTFDSRYTGKPMVLNVRVAQYYCEQEKRAIVLFRFSPKAFEHDVWNLLETVELNANACEH